MQFTLTDTIQTETINIPEAEHLTYVALLQNGWEERRKLNFNFNGKNARLTFIAIILGTDKNKFPFDTYSNHISPDTQAHYFVRNALFDESQVDYIGFLNILEGAQHTDANLAHHSLMLSPKAKTNTTPSLEIEANDVKASHAATIGRLDDDTLFYMASRGIDQRQAQNILIKGFLTADLKEIQDEKIREQLAAQIESAIF